MAEISNRYGQLEKEVQDLKNQREKIEKSLAGGNLTDKMVGDVTRRVVVNQGTKTFEFSLNEEDKSANKKDNKSTKSASEDELEFGSNKREKTVEDTDNLEKAKAVIDEKYRALDRLDREIKSREEQMREEAINATIGKISALTQGKYGNMEEFEGAVTKILEESPIAAPEINKAVEQVRESIGAVVAEIVAQIAMEELRTAAGQGNLAELLKQYMPPELYAIVEKMPNVCGRFARMAAEQMAQADRLPLGLRFRLFSVNIMRFFGNILGGNFQMSRVLNLSSRRLQSIQNAQEYANAADFSAHFPALRDAMRQFSYDQLQGAGLRTSDITRVIQDIAPQFDGVARAMRPAGQPGVDWNQMAFNAGRGVRYVGLQANAAANRVAAGAQQIRQNLATGSPRPMAPAYATVGGAP